MLEKNAALRATRRRRLALVGPAFVAAIAYVDPGNFATNVSGRRPVRLPAALGDRLGQPDGDARAEPVGEAGPGDRRSLPENCRKHYRRPVVLGLWVQAELVAMATDLAEVVGGAIALNLLFGAAAVHRRA